ncbi:MAG: HAD family phosphatase [Bacteroidales bacterium]|nr:HAD family phosphatase [Bacteroidales bacterium]
MSGQIKNIIFDFGGVIINISHRNVENAFRNLEVHNFEELFNKAIQSELFQKLETGQITDNEFRDTLRTLTGIDVPDEKLDDTWNQIIGDYRPQRIDLLKTIRQNYRLYLLSNTNHIHFEFYIRKFKNEFGSDFVSLFEKTYWSFKIGCRKPDDSPYLHVLNENSLNPEETLFIDDSIQNIKTAQKLNIRTIHLNQETDVTDLFENGFLIEKFLD